MKLIIEIQMDNAAFGDDWDSRHLEMCQVLRKLLSPVQGVIMLENAYDKGDQRLLDSNGNGVGQVRIED